ncbi:MAG: DUF1289 domain-containing protein [Gammaproteobacteria bacterium]|nr:DUF1289 domain-containing protein [Gammaproteobacteria bacterium]
MSEETIKDQTTASLRPSQDRSTGSRRGGRRGRANSASAASQIDTSIPSPCVAVCQFNGEPFCQGCYRNIDEIREWMIMSKEQKLAVLDAISKRRMEETGEQLW